MCRAFLVACFYLLPSLLWAQQGQIDITVSNIEVAQGVLRFAVLDNPDNWLKTKPDGPPFADANVALESTDDVTVSIKDVPPGIYAVSVFQDVNNNGKLDTNFIGYPKEPFGFSAPGGKFGPPKFDKASFTVEQDTRQIAVELH